ALRRRRGVRRAVSVDGHDEAERVGGEQPHALADGDPEGALLEVQAPDREAGKVHADHPRVLVEPEHRELVLLQDGLGPGEEWRQYDTPDLPRHAQGDVMGME